MNSIAYWRQDLSERVFKLQACANYWGTYSACSYMAYIKSFRSVVSFLSFRLVSRVRSQNIIHVNRR
jgi:hypothetical protein